MFVLRRRVPRRHIDLTTDTPFNTGWLRSIGAPGFEPGTSCSRSMRANRTALRPVIGKDFYENKTTNQQNREGYCKDVEITINKVFYLRPENAYQAS